MSPRLSLVSADLIPLLAMASACGEPSREDYRDDMVAARCDRLMQCGDDTYDSYEDCEIDVRAFFNDLWPSDQCSDGRISEAKFEFCRDLVATSRCDPNFFQQVGDVAEFNQECSADAVCIDPAD